MADSQASYFALWKPDLNEREDTDRLVLLKYGVT